MILGAFVTAVRTLTIIPVPGKDGENHSYAPLFFPVTGAGLGMLLYAIARGCAVMFDSAPLVSGLVVTVATTVLTGCMHVDGLADVADGFGGGRTKERILEIFKDSHHGTFGVCAVTFDLAARILLVGLCVGSGNLFLIALCAIFSRTLMAWTCVLFPYAREKEGKASLYFNGRNNAIALCAITASFLAVTFFIFGTLPLAVAFCLSLLPVELFLMYCMRKIGGVSGDCIGAVNEISELSLLLTGYLTLRSMPM